MNRKVRRSRGRLGIEKEKAIEVIKSAKSFIVYAVDYHGELKMAGGVRGAVNPEDADIRLQSVAVAANYLGKMREATEGRHKQLISEAAERQKVADVKALRSKELAGSVLENHDQK